MAQVTLWGATYSDVPAVDLPSGNSTVRFYEAATHTATISGSGNMANLYIQFGSDKYYTDGDTIAFQAGDEFSLVSSGRVTSGTIVIDGVTVASGNPARYTYELPDANLDITLYYGSSGTMTIVTMSSLQTKNYTVSSAGTASVTPDSGYDGLSQVNVSVPSIESDLSIGSYGTFSTVSGQRKWNDSAYADSDGVSGWFDGTLQHVNINTYNAVPSNTTVTPTTSSQTIGGANYMMEGAVTVAAMPSGTAGTPTATKGTVSNHQVSITPSVTNTTGYITGSTKTGTSVTVTASELASGNKEITQNGTGIDVVGYATVSVDVQGGGGGGLTVGTATTTASAESSLTFTGLGGQPTSFVIISTDEITTSAITHTATIVYDGSTAFGQGIVNTSNAQVSPLSSGAFVPSYNNGTLTINLSGNEAVVGNDYSLIYTYNGSDIGTADVQVGSGATSITFTGLEEEPSYFSCVFKSNFSTSSGYQRVIAVVYDGTDIYGLEMDSSAKPSSTHWSYTYNNGSLTISSQGTNAGGYFHQPGYYQLTYATEGDAGNYQSKTVTPTTSTQTVTADSGYDALKKVTVNAIPSEYIIPSGNINITSNTASGSSLNVSQYATATVNVPTGGGSTSVGQTTWSNNSTSTVSHQFTGLSGTPKFAVLRCTSQLTRSSSNTYYYIADIIWDGTDAWGNYHLRSNGSYNNVSKTATSGFNVSVGTNSITFSSDASSRSSAPGSFFNGTYELTYVY